MDSGFNAVEHLEVKLGKLVFFVGRLLLDIPQGGGIDNVSDDEPLDCLVLGNGLSGGNTTDSLNVSASLLVASVVAPLDSHPVTSKSDKLLLLSKEKQEEQRRSEPKGTMISWILNSS